MSEEILSTKQIEHKIERMAYQILEANREPKEIIIAGIVANGYAVAERIAHYMRQISDKKIVLCRVEMDKKNPLNPIHTSIELASLENKSVTIVDDVLHSGTTLIYAVRHFLQVPLQMCTTAVLVDRNHKKFPIKADFKGVSLSTSINENVSVLVNQHGFSAVLE